MARISGKLDMKTPQAVNLGRRWMLERAWESPQRLGWGLVGLLWGLLGDLQQLRKQDEGEKQNYDQRGHQYHLLPL